MATTKFATIRYQALDRCFSNFGRKYDIHALVDACNKAIYEYNGDSNGISKRTVYDDINFMQSPQGWSVELEKTKEGKEVYYRYADPNFSINKQSLNEEEVNQLKQTIAILNRFEGVEQFEWVEDLKIKMETIYKIKSNTKPIVSFDHNIDLVGRTIFGKLFNAIQYGIVLNIKYQSFNQLKPTEMIIHPYHLKQYNNRWFLFGLNNDRKELSNLALDRIQNIEEVKIDYIEMNIDFNDYFYNVIGVTVKEGIPTEKVVLFINNQRWAYVKTKPIHGTQKVKNEDSLGVTIEIDIQINKELVNVILSYGSDMKVLEPKHLKEQIINKIKQMNENYFDV